MTITRAAAAVLAAAVLTGPAVTAAADSPAAPLSPAAAGQITIYSSPGIHLSARSYTHDYITAGPDGAVWFTNPGNNTIGRISPATGKVTDYRSRSIADPWAITSGPDGAVWFTNFGGPSIGRITTTGQVRAFTGAVNGPNAITAGPDRALWYSNWPAGGKCGWSIGRMTTNGKSTCFKHKGVVYPQDNTVGPDGAVWFTIGGADGRHYGIGRITAAGKITTYPLAHYPGSITAGPDGALWFTYPADDAIGRITTTGVVTSYYTSPSISDPYTIAAGPDGALWFINTGNNTIGRITTSGRISHYAGRLGLGGTGRGAGITAGPDGAMWFTNPVTSTIGRITTSVTPAIFRKTPRSGAPGTEVTITGRNLSPATQISFNGTPATIISDSATYVVAIVPPGATTGRIAVTTPAGTAAANGWFVVTLG